MSVPVNVLAVIDEARLHVSRRLCTDASREITNARLTEARAAVAELIEAAKDMRDCLRILRDDYQCEQEDLDALNRGEAALARVGEA